MWGMAGVHGTFVEVISRFCPSQRGRAQHHPLRRLLVGTVYGISRYFTAHGQSKKGQKSTGMLIKTLHNLINFRFFAEYMNDLC